MGKVTKQWKTDGQEDKFLHKLIKKGKINKNTSPKTLMSDYPVVFGSFSENVVRNHLNAAKRITGLYLASEEAGCAADETSNDEEEKEDVDALAPNSHIDGSSNSSTISHHNYPVVVKEFTCPITELEKVLVVVSLPGAAQKLKVELGDDGCTVAIKYSWPKTMYSVSDLFKTQLASGELNLYHPMVLCVKAGLTQVRKKIDVAPESVLKIKLPIKVQTSVNSWKKWGVKRDEGTLILVAEFTGYVKEYLKKAADEQVAFL